MTSIKTLEQRMDENIVYEALTGCWLWGGKLTHDGYPVFSSRNVTHYAHRAVYEKEIGPIPEGLTLDHLCRVRCCVNPSHMEPVTLSENISRGNYGWRGSLTHCKNGHEFSGRNLIIRSNGEHGKTRRDCRQCMNESQRRYQARKARVAAVCL